MTPEEVNDPEANLKEADELLRLCGLRSAGGPLLVAAAQVRVMIAQTLVAQQANEFSVEDAAPDKMAISLLWRALDLINPLLTFQQENQWLRDARGWRSDVRDFLQNREKT